MNTNLKKVILIFGGGLLVYWVFTKIKPFGGSSKKKSSSKSETKLASSTNVISAIPLVSYFSNSLIEKNSDHIIYLSPFNKTQKPKNKAY